MPEQNDISHQVFEFLTTWMVSHILGSDLKIARSLAQDRTGKGKKTDTV